MRASGRLTGSGLVQRNRGGRHNLMPFNLSDRLALALLAEVDSIADLIALMFPRAAGPQAEWQDFEGLGSDADLMRDLLSSALGGAQTGRAHPALRPAGHPKNGIRQGAGAQDRRGPARGGGNRR